LRAFKIIWYRKNCTDNVQITNYVLLGKANVPHLTSLKLDASGKYTWKTGSDSFVNWCPQQPAQSKGDCAAIVDGCMKVVDCEQAAQFLCEEST
jgi:hypothetical protein